MTTNPSDSAPPFHPYFALIFGVFAVSTGAIFARLADANPLVIAAYRVGIAALVLTPLAWCKARDELKSLTSRELTLALISGLFLAMHFATWIASLNYTTVANSVVLVNTNPLWVGLLTPLIAKEHIKKAAIISIIISVIGGVIIGMGDFATGKASLLGDGLALCGSICAAIYLLLGRNLRRRLSLLSYISVCYGSAAIILWLVVLVLNLRITGFSINTYAAFLGMALVSQLIGHTCYNWALKWFTAGLIAVSLLGEPVIATFLAYLMFDEGLNWPKVIGGILILTAIYIAASAENKNAG